LRKKPLESIDPGYGDSNFSIGGNKEGLRTRKLDLVAFEQVVLIAIAAGTLGALKAADEEDRDRHRYQDGENARINHQPVKDPLHLSLPAVADNSQPCSANCSTKILSG
jgi:hypothetical protein